MKDLNENAALAREAESTLVSTRQLMTSASDDAHPIKVTWRAGEQKQTEEFTVAITLGRDASCDVRIDDEGVSRTQARIYPEAGQWHVADLDSANGTFLDRVPIRHAILPRQSTLQLGSAGPTVWIEAPGAQATALVEEIAEHYFGDSSGHEAGHRTLMLRRAYRSVEKKQKLRYRGIIAGAIGLLLVSIGIGIHQFLMLQQSRQTAMDIFYNMKTLEVQIARVEDLVPRTGDGTRIAEVDALRHELRAMEAQYDQFLDELGVLGPELSEQDRVILRVARMFGECELNMPGGFAREVKRYIDKWKTTDRLKTALQRMDEQELGPTISSAMLDNHLPPQFLYLALQESGFDTRAVGPETRFGIPKGIWQFIPATARRYGLRTGPLVELPRHDPMDERFEPARATEAAARYLRDIYNNETQASGLLVVASYNWGPTNIRKRIREMPDNPRDRNFWQLLKHHEIPTETYNYVFYIVSAIVIGEDPALFGFDFENPLEVIDQSLVADLETIDL